MDKFRHKTYTEKKVEKGINKAKTHVYRLYSMPNLAEQNLYYNFFFLKRTRRVLISAASTVLQEFGAPAGQNTPECLPRVAVCAGRRAQKR